MNERVKVQNQQDDRVLIKAFLSNVNSAFDELVLKYKDKVFNLSYRFLADYEEANDCSQEVFLKVFRSLKNFRFESAFSTWLYRVTVNTCKNKLTSLEYQRRKRIVRINNPVETEKGTYSIEIKDESMSPDAILERKEKNMLIQEAIGSLPAEYREVVLLRDIQGLSYEVISQITGDKLGTVKSRLARGRVQIMQKLKGMV